MAQFRRIIAFLVVVMLFAPTATVGQTVAAVSPAEPVRPALVADAGLTAAGAIAVDLTTGIELYAHNADVSLPPASTAKIVTAAVVS
ncbi:MAG TPA: D-alanyl-D-alanine carboxypeptidase, partial [Thermomicrobiales bacterium]|nr:D-alanyl-D-alanine carboxypeptidase [Thermomicrobiales bacterium]